MIECLMQCRARTASFVASLVLALAFAAPPALAQGVEAEGARETIIGSEVKTDETSAEDDAERIVAAIENSAETTQEVRRRFNLGEVAIVLVTPVHIVGSAVPGPRTARASRSGGNEPHSSFLIPVVTGPSSQGLIVG
jgi:hypothetical protein